MNSVLEEMQAILNSIEEDKELMHIGMPRRSGRYPWGSGEDPYQRTRDLLGRIEVLKKQGWTETPENIQKEFGLTTRQYRAQKSLAGDLRRIDQIKQAESLKSDGLNNSEIGRKMGINESTVRSLLDEDRKARTVQAMNTADFIRSRIQESDRPMLIGGEVHRELNISKEKMDVAVAILEAEGFEIRGGRVNQVTNPGQKTTIKLLCPPGAPKNAAYDLDNIETLNEYVSQDGGDTFRKKFTYPASLDSKRLMIRYDEDGGTLKDGLVEIRRGVDDLSLGNDHYSQVRILVNGNKYIKGMAVYSDNMPDGVDIIFNTNKSKSKGMEGALKDIKKDPDNPFGSAIKDAEQGGQYWYTDKKTGEQKLGLINKRAGEGDWSEWKDSVPSQFLSKQAVPLAKKQLGIALHDRKNEYDAICELTNPTIKKHLLNKFADECDAAAVHLQAAALPGQKYRVIIPVSTLKDNEVYAPTYENGSTLALVRYPHGGTFEIPILTVNNKHRGAKEVLGNDITDAVAINKKVADRLSGADFDGDTVMCIPVKNASGDVITNIRNQQPLKGLIDFDTRMSYGADSEVVDTNGKTHYYRNGREYKTMAKGSVQNEMGRISNLITDMTLRGANNDELEAAVKHSMVVIDAYKHHLDYKQSEIDNNISYLKKYYQEGGASTLISRSKGEYSVPKRQGTPVVNVPGASMRINGKKVDVYDPNKPEGSLIWKTADNLEYTVANVKKRTKNEPNATVHVSSRGKRYIQFDDNETWIPMDGKSDLEEGSRVYSYTKTKTRTQKSTNMAETDDAYTLISDADTRMERVYADYANSMKSMANQARKEMMSTGKIKYDSSAKIAYQAEVQSLMSKLNNASLNAPKEQMAQIKANAEVAAKRRSNPDMSKEEIKKAGQQALEKYRIELGAVSRRKRNIQITDREWDAIQAGAISENQLVKILNNTDIGDLRARATPRTSKTLSAARVNTIKARAASGYTVAEIAKQLGLSPSTVSNYLKGSD